MRLWSIHPRYLDRIGLVAVWREGLLAKRVLEGKTKGYRNHPQLLRFKGYRKPVDLIDAYLFQVYLEAERRGYSFDRSKIRIVKMRGALAVTRGQLEYEFVRLLKKLEARDEKKFEELKGVDPKTIEPNPVFEVVDGEVENWEIGGDPAPGSMRPRDRIARGARDVIDREARRGAGGRSEGWEEDGGAIDLRAG